MRSLKKYFPLILFLFFTLIFSWKFFLRSLVPIPSDVIVGIYFPWRDHIWKGFVAGVPIKNGLLSDVVSIILPWRTYGIQLMKNGKFPLWIPQHLAGTPLLANFQSGMFYPLNFLFFIFSNINAWSLYIISQPFLASIFCYLYLRNLKLSQFASIIGAVLFAFCGFMLVWFEYGILGHAGLWLPLFLLLTDKINEKKWGRWIILGSFAVAFSILAGYPQITIYCLAVFIFYVFYRFFQTKNKKVLLSFVPLFLGVLLSAAQILPGAELLARSIRQTDPTTGVFSYGIVPLKNLVLFFAPDFFGNPATGNWWGWAGYNESVCYVGIFGLVFAFFSFLTFSKKNREALFFKLIFIFSLLFAFQGPLASLPRSLNLPGLKMAVGGRILFLADFCLAILAAFGIESFIKKNNHKKWSLSLLSVGAIFLFLWLFVFFLARKFFPQASFLANLAVSKRNLILPTLIFFTLVPISLVNSLFKKNKIVSYFLKLAVFSLVVFDLFRFGWKYNPFTPKDFFYPKTNLLSFLEEKKGVDRLEGLLPQSMWIPYHLYSTEGYDPMMVRRFSEYANQINEEKPKKEVGSGSRWVRNHLFSSPLINISGTKYLISFKGDAKTEWEPEYYKYSEKKYQMIFQYGKTQIYENKESLPRAFIAHDYKVVKDDNELMRILLDKDFNYRKTIVLEENPLFLPSENTLPTGGLEIAKDDYLKNNFTLKTKTEKDGLLFLSDVLYPGWKAFVDNIPTKIYRADYIFRAVVVPSGEHTVKFIYDPLSFKIGLWLSLGTLVSLLGTGVIMFKFKKEQW